MAIAAGGQRPSAGALRSPRCGVYALAQMALYCPRRDEPPRLPACGASLARDQTSVVRHNCVPMDDDADIAVTVLERRGVRVHERGGSRRDLRQPPRHPRTSPARTLVDLTEGVDGSWRERATTRAQAHNLRKQADSCGPDRHRRSRLGLRESTRVRHVTRSRPRSASSPHARRPDPPPEGTPDHGHEVDFLWRRHRLIVEIDGFQYHSTRSAFERDRRRRTPDLRRGLRVLRVTWRQLVERAVRHARPRRPAR